MTGHIQDDGDLDRRLSDGLTALHGALDQILDLDAGLADATLPGRAHALTRDLDSALDLDAGLAAILPTRPATPPIADQLDPRRTLSASALRRFADDLLSQPAHQRLRVRTWLPRQQLITIHALALLGHRTREELRSRAREVAREVDQAHACSRDLDDVLDHALDGDRDLTLDRARDLARGLALALDRARDLARGLALALDRVLDRARDLDHTLDLYYARDLPVLLDRALDHALALASELDNTLNDVLDVARYEASAVDLNLALVPIRNDVRVLDRVLDLDHARDDARDYALDHARAMNPGRAVVHAFTAALTQDRGGDEKNEHELITAVEIMEKAVSDVVGADLDGADLRGIPLEGVRWSSTTRWPPDWTEWVRRASVPVGHDLWEIRSGGLSVDEFVVVT